MKYTPWGKPQHIHSPIDGIWVIETASHGGFYLSDRRVRELDERLRILGPHPRYWTFAGNPQWWEEDDDYAVPVVAFWQEFLDKGALTADQIIGVAKQLQAAAERAKTDAGYLHSKNAWEDLDGTGVLVQLEVQQCSR